MLGLPRTLPRALPRLANARDVATAASGLRPGVLLRSDAPRSGDELPDGLAWPPRTVLDLRDPAESRKPHPLAGIADVRAIPIIEEASFQRLMAGEGTTLADMYDEMIRSPEAVGLAQVVDAVATEPGPVLVHCSAGKDRTGVSIALVLALLGVPRDAIVADYVATEANMREVMARVVQDMPMRKRVLARLTLGGVGGGAAATAPAAHAVVKALDGAAHQVPGPREAPGAGTAACAPGGKVGLLARTMALLGAPAQAIRVVLDAWDEHPGGVQGWYLEHGGDRETLEALRARMLSP